MASSIAWIGAITGALGTLLGGGNLIHSIVQRRAERKLDVRVTASFRVVRSDDPKAPVPGYDWMLMIRAVNAGAQSVVLDAYAVSTEATGSNEFSWFRVDDPRSLAARGGMREIWLRPDHLEAIVGNWQVQPIWGWIRLSTREVFQSPPLPPAPLEPAPLEPID